jgi:dTDP-4-amino-4,6-dideoxygalactose transaminase
MQRGVLSKTSVWPVFGEDEIEAVSRVLKSGRVNYWTGDECRTFEREFADFVGADYAVAVANGTVAIELALEALGLGVGDEIITTPRTFIATASAAVRRGMRVVFADVDPDSQNITAETLSRALSPRTKAVVVVHLAGWPCDMDPILTLAKDRGLYVVEDCAQAHGATYKGRPVGQFGHCGTFSFCQDKIMTTGGEGGMVVTNDRDLWSRVWSLKDHGKDYAETRAASDPSRFRWLHHGFGSNQRMTEMQAAIGRRQLRKLPGWIEQRRKNASVLIGAMKNVSGLRIPVPNVDFGHAYYKFYAFVEAAQAPGQRTRDELVQRLQRAGIPCGPGSCSEIYLEKAFENTGMRPDHRLPNAVRLGETSLMLQVDPTWDEHDLRTIGTTIVELMGERAA